MCAALAACPAMCFMMKAPVVVCVHTCCDTLIQLTSEKTFHTCLQASVCVGTQSDLLLHGHGFPETCSRNKDRDAVTPRLHVFVV